MYASIDLAMDKIEKQLKRYKEKLKSHHGRERVHHHQDLVEQLKVRHRVFEGHGAVAEVTETAQKIVKTNEFLAHPMGIEEAVMQMDLMNNDFYVFTNSTTMEMNVVYHRKDGTIAAFDNDLRMQTLLDDVRSTSRKALIFVPFKHALAGISEALKADGVDHAVVSGDTSLKVRTEVFSHFQNTSKYHAIVAHPQCLAHGVTLTAADMIVWFGPTTSFETYDQANARIRRVGQKHKQLILKYMGSPVERKIYKMLANNQQIQSHLLDLIEANNDVALA
jgi:SNF2 family DNA or RNA helicase